MKKTTKMAGLVAGLMILAGVSFTACDPNMFGDDFRGTWLTLDFDANGVRIPTYQGTNSEGQTRYYKVRWFFNGKSENIKDNGYFSQHLISYDTAPTLATDENGNKYYALPAVSHVAGDTYWFGPYDLTGNSGYSKGKFFLHYQAAFDIKTAITQNGVDAQNGQLVKNVDTTYDEEQSKRIVAVLDTWTLDNFVSWCGVSLDGPELSGNYPYNRAAGFKPNGDPYAEGATSNTQAGFYSKNNVQLQVKKSGNKILCSDIEYFRFNLKNPDASGYSRMMGTTLNKNGVDTIGGIYNQWMTDDEASNASITKKSNSYGYKVSDAAGWSGTNKRFMGRIAALGGSNEYNPKFLYSDTTPNANYFNVVDSEDNINYENPDALAQ